MTGAWHRLLLPPLLVTVILLVGSQAMFLRASFYRDLSYGMQAPSPGLSNYVRVLTDPFYLGVLWQSMLLAAAAAVWTILLGFPLAYVLARMRSRFAPLCVAVVLLTSFVTIAIKIYGLLIIFSADGPLNQTLLRFGLVDRPVTIIGTRLGVVLGLSYFSFGFALMLLYGMVRTIPRALEESATIHGAGRVGVFRHVILPLSLPGVMATLLTVFNLCMGAFTSAALLGAGRILTLPVLIEQTILGQVRYGLGSALAALLMSSVLAVNLIATALVRPSAPI